MMCLCVRQPVEYRIFYVCSVNMNVCVYKTYDVSLCKTACRIQNILCLCSINMNVCVYKTYEVSLCKTACRIQNILCLYSVNECLCL